MKAIFCYVYKFWLSKFVDSKDDLLVRFIDYFFAGKCGYCTNYRVLASAFGAGLTFVGGWVTLLGLGLIVLAILMALGERYWLCDVKNKS